MDLFSYSLGNLIQIVFLCFTDTINDGGRPRSIAILPDGTRAYVTNQADGTVSVIDTATNTVIDIVPVDVAPSGIETGTICQ